MKSTKNNTTLSKQFLKEKRFSRNRQTAIMYYELVILKIKKSIVFFYSVLPHLPVKSWVNGHRANIISFSHEMPECTSFCSGELICF